MEAVNYSIDRIMKEVKRLGVPRDMRLRELNVIGNNMGLSPMITHMEVADASDNENITPCSWKKLAYQLIEEVNRLEDSSEMRLRELYISDCNLTNDSLKICLQISHT